MGYPIAQSFMLTLQGIAGEKSIKRSTCRSLGCPFTFPLGHFQGGLAVQGHGAAQLGIVGSDVLMEFDYSELYAPVDLGIGVEA